jgi:uncharacterized protein with HEPN domain
MSKRESSFYFIDIFIASFKIQKYISGFTNCDDFLHEDLYWDATMRELQIIGEATNQLMKFGFLDDSYRDIVDFRNVITHGYFGINASMVWGVVNDDLRDYVANLKLLIKEKNVDLSQAIKYAIKEHKNQSKYYIVEFLEDI